MEYLCILEQKKITGWAKGESYIFSSTMPYNLNYYWERVNNEKKI